MDPIEILNQNAVGHKINRMVYEIWERNADQKELFIIGIQGVGSRLAEVFHKELSKISDLHLQLGHIHIDKENVHKEVLINFNNLKGKNVLVIDDVANSGKTLLYSLIPILRQLPKKVEIAVLVNRKHKLFPVRPDIIGHEVSTTIQDKILVRINQNQKISVFLA